MPAQTALHLAALKNIATRLRIDSLRATSEAGSGHPTTCCSAAEIMSALFFAEMRYDPRDPGNADNDRFVLSKGHAAPVLYAAWAEAGIISEEELQTYGSDESRLPMSAMASYTPGVEISGGSLGHGLAVANGIAMGLRHLGNPARVFNLLSDGELDEGST